MKGHTSWIQIHLLFRKRCNRNHLSLIIFFDISHEIMARNKQDFHGLSSFFESFTLLLVSLISIFGK